MSAPTKQPADVLRAALVAMLADLLREAEAKAGAFHDHDFYDDYCEAVNDVAAIRRVIEILQRTGGAGRDARAREGTPATPEGGANPSPSTMRRDGELGKEDRK